MSCCWQSIGFSLLSGAITPFNSFNSNKLKLAKVELLVIIVREKCGLPHHINYFCSPTFGRLFLASLAETSQRCCLCLTMWQQTQGTEQRG